ncbi:hypothetical protein [Microtetraspora sp. NBRC 16547]|uniref:hypothetical protein n=1 Tax=Microtetraspora sp. NBRC 16547 TaxID=3030993 RepID=UPI0024A5E548|nr:hypothetical protein [Microtetraspora sp. NBRC 16547]GLW98787.1 hypothetical protein Misp02_28740 [Microtetraspora sp. NBRC 16547]
METLESFVRRNAHTTRGQYDTAATELIRQLDQLHRPTSDRLHDAAYFQALHVWWDMVLMQVDKYDLDIGQAVRQVRAWATRYLTCVPGPTKPGTLFDHALAHTGRAAARRFLAATGDKHDGAATQR